MVPKVCNSLVFCVQVKRCNEMCRRLRFFHEQVALAEIPLSHAVGELGHDLDELEVRIVRKVVISFCPMASQCLPNLEPSVFSFFYFNACRIS